jgi:hypothetical protein
VIRPTDEAVIRSLGEYGRDDFFVVVLIAPGDDDTDRPGGVSTFGLLVDDLDATQVPAPVRR